VGGLWVDWVGGGVGIVGLGLDLWWRLADWRDWGVCLLPIQRDPTAPHHTSQPTHRTPKRPTPPSQVRSTGTVNQLTKQPIKGRKLGGGIRFGEMERDSLLAHGAAYLLHDRLHACSDYHTMDVCTK